MPRNTPRQPRQPSLAANVTNAAKQAAGIAKATAPVVAKAARDAAPLIAEQAKKAAPIVVNGARKAAPIAKEVAGAVGKTAADAGKIAAGVVAVGIEKAKETKSAQHNGPIEANAYVVSSERACASSGTSPHGDGAPRTQAPKNGPVPPLSDDPSASKNTEGTSAKGVAQMIGGAAIAAAGVPMLILPGPGVAAIAGGAALAAKGARTAFGMKNPSPCADRREANDAAPSSASTSPSQAAERSVPGPVPDPNA